MIIAAISSSASKAQIVLDDFSALNGTLSGSWVSNATIVTDTVPDPDTVYLQVGGTAKNINGYNRSGLSINATGQLYLEVIGRRDSGHDIATNVAFQFEDSALETAVFQISSSVFSDTAFSTVYIPVNFGTANPAFDLTSIEGWSFGGGSTGSQDFHMSFDNVSFTITTIPEPSTYALLALGLGAILFVRRRAAKA